MRVEAKNLGFIQQIQIGSFNTPAAGSAVQFVFNNMPDLVPGGYPYEILDIILRFPTGCIQFPVPAGQMATARTLWSIIRQSSFNLSPGSPQGMLFGVPNPEQLWNALPGVMIAEMLAMHSRSRVAEVDGDSFFREVIAPSNTPVIGPQMLSRPRVQYDGYIGTHGPYAVGNVTFGVNNQVDLILPVGRRANDYGMEDFDDQALPSHWLSGKPLPGSSLTWDAARLDLQFGTIVEGGGALTLAAGQTVQVWANVIARRGDRASCPALPVIRWNAPPSNTSQVSFFAGAHFWSGFGAADASGCGNCDASYNVLPQTFGSAQIQQGSNVQNYPSATEYLKVYSAMVGTTAPGRRAYAWGASDDPMQPQSMALLRERMGIFPVGIPLPLLLSMGSDSDRELLLSYTAPVPVLPWQLQSLYPLWTPNAMNTAAAASGLRDAMCVDAIDSALPKSGISRILPKAIRTAKAA